MKVLLTVILGVFLSQSNAYSPLQTCAIVQTNTFIADPTDCSGYYYCVDGAISSSGNCDSGMLYNSHSGTCDYAQNVQCNFGAEVCKSYTAPIYLPNPSDCSSYMYCDGRGNTLYNSCPTGQDFDQESISCQWATSTSCAGSPCDLVPNNKFVSNGQRTNTAGDVIYLSMTCYNGIGSPHECPVGYIYNSIVGQCEWNTQVDDEPNCVVGAGGAVLVGNDIFTASASNCNQYYYCGPNTPPAAPETAPAPTLLSCPQQFHFNAATGMCVYSWTYQPAGANANCDRCGGWATKKFVVNTKVANCNSYLYCITNSDGISVTNQKYNPGRCSNSGYQYFSEKSQACVGTKPEGFCSA